MAQLGKNHTTSVKHEHRKDQDLDPMAEDIGIDANSNSDEDKQMPKRPERPKRPKRPENLHLSKKTKNPSAATSS